MTSISVCVVMSLLRAVISSQGFPVGEVNILEKDTSKRGRDLIRTHRGPQFELFYFSVFLFLL